MNNQKEIDTIHAKIQQMKQVALELNQHDTPYPFLKRNTERILASIKMLELNISDLAGAPE